MLDGLPVVPPIFMFSIVPAVIVEEAMVEVAAAVVLHSKTDKMFVPAVAGVEETRLSICIVDEPEGREMQSM